MCLSTVKETKINVTRFEYPTFETDAERMDQREERQTRGGAIINTLSHFNK